MTQVIGYQGRSKSIINIITEREIIKINKFEEKCKIKTNIQKFSPLHLNARVTCPLNINDTEIEFKSTGKTFGLKN